jgi:hypothetical protein
MIFFSKGYLLNIVFPEEHAVLKWHSLSQVLGSKEFGSGIIVDVLKRVKPVKLNGV